MKSSTEDGKYYIRLDDAGILRSRREQFGFSQQEVARRAGINLRLLHAYRPGYLRGSSAGSVYHGAPHSGTAGSEHDEAATDCEYL